MPTWIAQLYITFLSTSHCSYRQGIYTVIYCDGIFGETNTPFEAASLDYWNVCSTYKAVGYEAANPSKSFR